MFTGIYGVTIGKPNTLHCTCFRGTLYLYDNYMISLQRLHGFLESCTVFPFEEYGTFLQQLECGYGFPALIHVWIASAGMSELFISTVGEAKIFNLSKNSHD